MSNTEFLIEEQYVAKIFRYLIQTKEKKIVWTKGLLSFFSSFGPERDNLAQKVDFQNKMKRYIFCQKLGYIFETNFTKECFCEILV